MRLRGQTIAIPLWLPLLTVTALAADAGRVTFQRLAAPALDRWTNAPDAAGQQWFRTHFARMGVFSPYFDAKTSWYPNGLVYVNLYGIAPDSPLLKDHRDWILRDGQGRLLYIPFDCKAGACAHYAGDIANPAFRAWWIRDVSATLSRGRYAGLWIDDVNMEFRVSDGAGKAVAPLDSSTGRTMEWKAWREHVAVFTEEIRGAFAKLEIVENPVWFAGPQPERDADPAIQRQIRAADNINLERGIASDMGLTGGVGEWSVHAVFDYIDRIHAAGRGVTMEEYFPDRAGKEYALAGYFLISSGKDRIGDAGAAPDNWWTGYDTDLGDPLGPRVYKNGVYSRRFSRGMVLLGEPGLKSQQVTLPGTFTTLDGVSVSSITLSSRQGAVLSEK